MADVFISYAHEDRTLAEMIHSVLVQEGFTVWRDERIPAGVQFPTEIEHELDRAIAVVVLWSQSSVNSDWVRNEAVTASEQGKLVPVAIDDVRLPLPHRLAKTIGLRILARTAQDEGMTEILTAVRRLQALSTKAFRLLQEDRLVGRVHTATKLAELISFGASSSDRARLELGYHEFARLGAHKARSRIRELVSGVTDEFVSYALQLLEAVCALSNADVSLAVSLASSTEPGALTKAERVSVALNETLVFGAVNDLERLERSWQTLSEAGYPELEDEILRARVAFDRAVRTVIYGREPIKKVFSGLAVSECRGLTHYSAALCKAVRKSDPILRSLVGRAQDQGWSTIPDPTVIRRRCRRFEVLALSSAGTLFGERMRISSAP